MLSGSLYCHSWHTFLIDFSSFCDQQRTSSLCSFAMNENALDKLFRLETKDALDAEDMEYLLKMSESENNEIRYLVAELLMKCEHNLSKIALIRLSNDYDFLVRTCACDSLSIFKDDEVVNLLVEKSKKKDIRLFKVTQYYL